MNDSDKLTEVEATLVLNDLKRRERLLKTAQGSSKWRMWAFCIGCSALILIVVASQAFTKENLLGMVLIPFVFGIIALFLDMSKRMDALIELIGEDRLRNPTKE